MSKQLEILSLSYTRELWEQRSDADRSRLLGYANSVGVYTVIVFSKKKHGLKPKRLAENFLAIPTDGWTPLDNWLRMIWMTLREARRRRYHLIQAQDPSYAGLAALLVGAICGLPINVCVYGPNPFDPFYAKSSLQNRVLALLGRAVLKRCVGIQVDGESTKMSLIAHGIPEEKISRKSLFASDIDEFQYLSRSASAPVSVELLFVGRLSSQKNLPMLLHAVAKLNEQCALPVTLQLLGDGPERLKLIRLADDLGISKQVIFAGARGREDVKRAFVEASIFVLPSWYEGFPRALLESSLAGLPSVATGVSGAAELIQDGITGYVVPIGDHVSFTAKLKILVESPECRAAMGCAARAHGISVLERASHFEKQVEIWEATVRRHAGHG